ncbi:MAG: low molecular weight phosphatase family protein, partial [Pseudomonadota bacterium]
MFVCNMNSVRSPMAAALLRAVAPEGFHVDSAGVYEGWLDPFAEAVMQEIGVTLEDHEP